MYKIISGSERKVAAGGGENFDFESLKMIRNLSKIVFICIKISKIPPAARTIQNELK